MNAKNEVKLVFVYNADSGAMNAFKDFFHKAFRKSTYQCNLCAVSFGAFGMKKEWKEFVNDLELPVEFLRKDQFQFDFLHKDEFHDKYHSEDFHDKFPSAYLEVDSELKLFISQEEMNAVKDLTELKDLVSRRIKEFGF
jgi:hypothetical protein